MDAIRLLQKIVNCASQSPLKALQMQAFSSSSLIQFSLLIELDRVPTVSRRHVPAPVECCTHACQTFCKSRHAEHETA